MRKGRNMTKASLFKEIEKLHSLLLSCQRRLKIISSWVSSEIDCVPHQIKAALIPLPFPDWEKSLEKVIVYESGNEIENDNTRDPLKVDFFQVEIEGENNNDTDAFIKQETSDHESPEDEQEKQSVDNLKFSSSDVMENDCKLFEDVENTDAENKKVPADVLDKSNELLENTTDKVPKEKMLLARVQLQKLPDIPNTVNEIEPRLIKRKSLRSASSKVFKAPNKIDERKRCKNAKTSIKKIVKNISKYVNPVKCKDCGITYSSVSSCRKHIRDSSCTKTPNLFSEQPQNDTFENAESSSDLTTNIDKAGINENYANENDVKEIHSLSEQNQDLTCSKCEKKFKNQKSLDCHLNGGCIVCPICKIAFTCRSYLNVHLKKQHENSVVCTVRDCREKFLNSRLLNTHVMKVHQPSEFKCELCNQLFSFYNYYRRHLIKKHPEQFPSKKKIKSKSSFSCDRCGRCFSVERNFKIHRLSENCLRVCRICTKLFTTKISLDDHVKRFHGNGTEHSFLCNVCGKSYVNSGRLNYHIKVCHTDENKGKTYECSYCGKHMGSRQSLYIHIKKHDGTARQQCPTCGRTFPTLTILKRHIKGVHEQMRPHHCNLCDKSFKTKSALKYHVNTHSNPHSKQRGYNKEKL